MNRGRHHSIWFRCVIGVFLILVETLSGCAKLSGGPLPTAFPSEYLPTAIAQTVAAARTHPATVVPSTASPTLSPTPAPPNLTDTIPPAPRKSASPTNEIGSPSPTLARPTRTPTLTPTSEIPFAPIQILSPGPGSRVVSPIKLSAYLEPGTKGNVTIELLGEDGRLLVRSLKSYSSGNRVYINQDIEYEITAVAEAGRLQISTRDEYGRLIALTSTDLLLLSIGDAELNPAGDTHAQIIIQQPKPKALIQGGKLSVSGLVQENSNAPLVAEILTSDGKPLGPTRLVNPTESEFDGYSAFNSQIPYSVKSPTWVRLDVYELNNQMPGILYLSSIELLLSP